MATTQHPPGAADVHLLQAPHGLLVQARRDLAEAEILADPADLSAWMFDWLPQLGPSAALLLARLHWLAENGYSDIDLRAVCRGLGLSWEKRNTARRAFHRLHRFGLLDLERGPDVAGHATTVVQVWAPIRRPPRAGARRNQHDARWHG